MRTVEISDSAFKKLEALRVSKKLSRAEVLTQAINRAAEVARLERDIERRSPEARELTGAEADRIATEEVRAERRSRSA
jgi:predicted CopG family antitoxin